MRRLAGWGNGVKNEGNGSAGGGGVQVPNTQVTITAVNILHVSRSQFYTKSGTQASEDGSEVAAQQRYRRCTRDLEPRSKR
jgi:hypothetical protein